MFTGFFLDDTTKVKLNEVVCITKLHFKSILTKCTTFFPMSHPTTSILEETYK